MQMSFCVTNVLSKFQGKGDTDWPWTKMTCNMKARLPQLAGLCISRNVI